MTYWGINKLPDIVYQIFCFDCDGPNEMYSFNTKDKVKARRVFSLHYHFLGHKAAAYSAGGRRGGYRLRWDLWPPPK